MRHLKLFALFVSVVVMAGCAQSASVVPPAQSTNRSMTDTAEAMPGDTAEAMPGDTAEALTGAQLACGGIFEPDRPHCGVAININIPPISAATTPANLLGGLHPSDIQNAYRLPSANAGGTVAIVDAYDDPNAETDLAVYRLAFGLPACTSLNGCFRKVNQSGNAWSYPAVNLGWSTEISLDLDMVSAVCPKCNILLVEANSDSFDDLGASVDTAAKLGAVAISNSYYGPEWSGETGEDAHYNHPGIAITVSAGDQPSAFYPAASPYVTSVGGTTLANGSESAWQYGARGCSRYESKPRWQTNTPCKTRSIVDVAAVADPQTGVTMFDTTGGGWLVAGGTSAGAPIVAAAYALSANPQGPGYSYERAGSFNDVAPAGYDLVTGLGSPAGVSGL